VTPIDTQDNTHQKVKERKTARNTAGLTKLDQALLRESLRLLRADPEFQQARQQASRYRVWIYDLQDMRAEEKRTYHLRSSQSSDLGIDETKVEVTSGQDRVYQELMQSGVIERLSQTYNLTLSAIYTAIFHRGEYPIQALLPRRTTLGRLVPEVYEWPDREPPGVLVATNLIPWWQNVRDLLVQEGVGREVLERVAAAAGDMLMEKSIHILGNPNRILGDPDQNQGNIPDLPEIWVRLDIPPGTPASEVARVYRIIDQRRRRCQVLLGRKSPQRRRASSVLQAAPDILLKPGRLRPYELVEELSKTTSSHDEDEWTSTDDDRGAAKVLSSQRSRIKRRRLRSPYGR
jgi:hypothetical protein